MSFRPDGKQEVEGGVGERYLECTPKAFPYANSFRHADIGHTSKIKRKLMPAVLSQHKDKNASLVDSKVRKRPRRHAIDSSQVTSRPMDSEDGGSSSYTKELTFMNGEWRERVIAESTVIVTEPRATDRDDGDSGISETPAMEERLLPLDGVKEGGDDRSPEYGNGKKKETILDTLIQIFIPFMIAGFGMMAAGLLLDAVQVGDLLSDLSSFSCTSSNSFQPAELPW